MRRRGGALDIHKLIGKLPKPKGGWTLPGHKYTGPYNDLESQVKYDLKTGKIQKIRPEARATKSERRGDHRGVERVRPSLGRFSSWLRY